MPNYSAFLGSGIVSGFKRGEAARTVGVPKPRHYLIQRPPSAKVANRSAATGRAWRDVTTFLLFQQLPTQAFGYFNVS